MANNSSDTPKDLKVDWKKILTPQDQIVAESVLELVQKILATQEKSS